MKQHSLTASNVSVKSEVKDISKEQALCELIWNGFDAGANKVEVSCRYVPELEELIELRVSDNGLGIIPSSIGRTFGHFKDSQKRDSYSPVTKGKLGIGRFSFCKLAEKAEWVSTSSEGAQRIVIRASSLNNFDIEKASPGNTGTEVLLTNPNNLTLDWFRGSATRRLTAQFSWFLKAQPHRELSINGQPLQLAESEDQTATHSINGTEFVIDSSLWASRPEGEKSFIYYLNSNNDVVHKELSGGNLKYGFAISVFVRSEWFDTYGEINGDLSEVHDANHPSFIEIRRITKGIVRDRYNQFVRRQTDELIEQLEKDQLLPEHDEFPPMLREAQKQNLKETIRLIHSAEPTLFGGQKLSKNHKKILIRLLDRITVDPPEILFKVLEGVVDLNSSELEGLAEQLKRTTLANIIRAVEAVYGRIQVLEGLKKLLSHFKKETGEVAHIQKIVENNLWLFGEQYHLLTAEEPKFEEALRKLLEVHGNEQYYQKGTIDHPSKNKEMDIFAIRRILRTDGDGKEYYHCLVVELKRTSETIKDKHYNQLFEYYSVIESSPLFNDGNHKWDFVLVGEKLSEKDASTTRIRSDLKGHKDKGIPGLLMKAGLFQIRYTPWQQLFTDHDIQHKYLLEHLQMQTEETEGLPDDITQMAINAGKIQTPSAPPLPVN